VAVSKPRGATFARKTRETDVSASLILDGTGQADVSTGCGFLDHLFHTLARFAHFDLRLTCKGDLHVDDHHTAEDCSIALGTALSEALGERAGIARFGHAYAPLDEALSRAVVDLSGRPWPEVRLDLKRERIGKLATENVTHVLNTLAITARMSLHVDVLRGENDHHKAESAFKATALALRAAVKKDGAGVPSTKGVLA